MQYNPALRALSLTGYEAQEGEFSMINNGHTGMEGHRLLSPGGQQAGGEWLRAAVCAEILGLQASDLGRRGFEALRPGDSSQAVRHLSADSVPCWPLPCSLASFQARSDPSSPPAGNSADRKAMPSSHTPPCVFR